tara:strand:+ start:1503 stop:1820 length:318 start_codon:yes stop_codon:yes gene_type:complete
MIVDRDHILKLAELANLTLAEDEIDSYISDINKILKLVSEVKDVDTEGVSPLSNVLDEFSEMREDEPEIKTNREEALDNAPDTDGVYFQVPATITHNKEKSEADE